MLRVVCLGSVNPLLPNVHYSGRPLIEKTHARKGKGQGKSFSVHDIKECAGMEVYLNGISLSFIARSVGNSRLPFEM